jgi:hypothetical protein
MTPMRKNILAGLILTALALVALMIEALRIDRPKLMARVYLGLVMIGLVALVLALGVHFARARDYGQWDRSNPIVQWYQKLMQPDNPAVSCCGEADAYWADSFEVDGDKYVAIITDSRDDAPLNRPHKDVGTKIIVPNHKIKWNEGNPTGHGVIFLSRNDYVFCYVPPGGV